MLCVPGDLWKKLDIKKSVIFATKNVKKKKWDYKGRGKIWQED